MIPKNSLVINEGDETDCLYIVVKGKAQALCSDESGRQFVVNRFDPHDYFGEMSLLDSNARCATVITKEKCTLMILPRKAFLGFVDTHPEIYRNVIDASDNRQKMEAACYLAPFTHDSRVMDALCKAAVKTSSHSVRKILMDVLKTNSAGTWLRFSDYAL